MATSTFRIERRRFVFNEKMKIGKDLEPLRKSGWNVVKNAHFLTENSDGVRIVTLRLRRLVRVK